MRLSLYAINDLIEQIIENVIDTETGEVLDEALYEQLNALEIEKDELVENILLEIKNTRAYAEELKQEKLEIEKKQKRAEKHVESLKKYVQEALAGEKFMTSKVSVTYRKTKSASFVGDIDTLPVDCVKIEKKVSKTELKKHLEAGEEIAGASIITNTSMIIK